MDSLTQHHLLVYGMFFLFSILFAFLINLLFLKFANTLGTKNNAEGTIIRWSSVSKPAIGGISFYILFLISIACYTVLFSPKQVGNNYNSEFVGILLSMAAGFLIGLADDAYNTKPFLKFSVQVLCSVILILSGIYIEISNNIIINYALTVFWVVGIMNSVNMLDNMDGITTTVSIFIMATIAVLIGLRSDFQNIHLIILTGVIASLLSFLYFNWNPSKMYMGDTGSQFLGVFLSAFSIIYFWNDPYPHFDGGISKHFVIPVIAFIVPIIDTTVVVINRTLRGNSPFVGGKDHTTHSLAYMGLTDRQVAMIFAAISANSMLIVIFIKRYLIGWSWEFNFIFGFYFMVLLAVFLYTTNRKLIRERLKEKSFKTEVKLNNVQMESN